MLRRRNTAESATTGATSTTTADAGVDLSKPGGKGRPTPKRNEALKQRKQAVRPPANRREAARQQRAASREERQKRMAAFKSGDERALPARDRGPVRRYVRDIVDSRFNIAEFFMPVVLVVLVLGSIPALVAFSSAVWILMILLLVVDSVRLRFRLKALLAQRFPDGESTKGALGYGLLRSLQFRALRLPKPQVKRGTKVV